MSAHNALVHLLFLVHRVAPSWAQYRTFNDLCPIDLVQLPKTAPLVWTYVSCVSMAHALTQNSTSECSLPSNPILLGGPWRFTVGLN